MTEDPMGTFEKSNSLPPYVLPKLYFPALLLKFHFDRPCRVKPPLEKQHGRLLSWSKQVGR